jgi:hypothetical protein
MKSSLVVLGLYPDAVVANGTPIPIPHDISPDPAPVEKIEAGRGGEGECAVRTVGRGSDVTIIGGDTGGRVPLGLRGLDGVFGRPHAACAL